MSKPQIGFIGLGAMGLPMAKNLVNAGYSLSTMIHRNPKPGQELREKGAQVRDSVTEVVQDSDVLLTILPADAQMEEVLLANDVLEAIRPGTILLEMTSGSQQMMQQVEQVYTERKIKVLDGPVSGGTAGAEQGTLTVMMGGDRKVTEEVQPILDVLAANVISVGDVGSGKAVKAINQMLAAVHMVATSEAIALAEDLEVDLKSLYDVITQSSGGSWMFANKFDSIVEQDFNPGFRLDLMKKDISIALAEAGQVPLPIASSAYQLYQMAVKDDGAADFAAVSKIIRSGKKEL